MSELAAAADDEGLRSYSLVELAVTRLSREILSGRVDPGERLVEEQLTQRLGISRAPLREALRLLAQQGLVEHVPRRGVRVATLSDDDVRQLYEVRDVLERHAIETALPLTDETASPTRGSSADRRPGQLRPGRDLDGLRAALAAMRAAARDGDRAEVAHAHRRFHAALVALAGNRQLSLLYESVLLKLQLYMALNLRREAETAAPLDGVHRHERLFDAVAGDDPAVVLAAVGHHGARSYLV